MAAPAPRLAPVTRAMRSDRSGMAVILNDDSQMAGRPRTHSDDALLDAAFRAVGAVGARAPDAGRRRPRGRASRRRRSCSASAPSARCLVAAAARAAARAGRARSRRVPARRRWTRWSTAWSRSPSLDARPRARSPTTSRCCSSIWPIPSCARWPSPTRRGLRRAIRALLDAAVAAGELEPCDTGALAAPSTPPSSGAQLDWAVDRRGTLARRVRRALDAVLRPGSSPEPLGAIVECSCPQCWTSSRRSSSWRSSRRSTSATSSSRAAGWPRSGTPTSRRPDASSSTSAT